MVLKTIPASRYAYIDFLRSISVILVILLHCIGGFLFNPVHFGTPLWGLSAYVNELCRIGVPLFFMMSGFLLLDKKIEDIGRFYKRRFLKIALPFLAYDAFYYLLLPTNHDPRSFFGWLKELVNCGSAYHLWFIYSILILYLFVPFIQKIVDHASVGELLIFLFLCTFQTTVKPLCNTLLAEKAYVFLSEDGVVGYLGYMVLGYILGKCTLPRRARVAIYAAGALSFIVCPIFVMNDLCAERFVWLNGGYTVNHYLEAAAVFVLCKTVITRPTAIFSRLAGLSMDMYFIHAFVLEKIRSALTTGNLLINAAVQIAAAVALSLLWAIFKTAAVKGVKKLFRAARAK